MLPRLLLTLLLITVQSAGLLCGLAHARGQAAAALAGEHDAHGAAHAERTEPGERCDVCGALAGFAPPPARGARLDGAESVDRGAPRVPGVLTGQRADGAGLPRAPPARS